MKRTFFASVLASYLLQTSITSAETIESYIVFSDKSGTATTLTDELSGGIYRAFAAQGFQVSSVGLGDSGKGIVITVVAECAQLAQTIKSAEHDFALQLDSCTALEN